MHGLRGRPVAGLLALALLVPLAGVPRSLAAQSPAERAELVALRDSLDAVRDTVALSRLEAAWIEEARHDRNAPMRHLRLGLLALRLGALGRRDGFDDAGSEFQWASELRPDWPWAWYGLGLAEYGILDSEVSLVAGIQAMFGKDRLTRAAGMFAKSAEVDPSFTLGLVDLAHTALEQRVNLRLAVALVALRRAATTAASRHPDVLLARGRIEREVGDADSSATAFRAYLSAGGDPQVGRLELARTLLSAGDLSGTDPYFAAASSGDPRVDSVLRADLRELVSDSELAGLDTLRGPDRGAWLRDFWARRDQGDLRRPGERLGEHYRRMWYARRNFRLVSARRQYRIEERFRSYSKEYDDRGLIYIRHGEPTERAGLTGQSLPLNQSWRYARPEGDLIFHFVAREDVQDFKLVESIYDILGFDAAVALRGGTAGDSVRRAAFELVQSRERLAPVYGRLLAAGGVGQGGLMDRERGTGRASIAEGTRTDSYVLRFDSPLEEARWEVLAAGAEGGEPLVHLVWAVPARSLRPVTSSRGVLYPVRLRFALVAEGSTRVAASVDSTTLFVSATEVPRGEFLVGRVAVPAPAGRYTWRVALQEGEAGTVSPTGTVEVGDEARFSVSDLVLGAASSNLRWVRGAEDTVYFNPSGGYRPEVPLELFFEILGLAPGAPYRTEIKVTRPGGLGPIGRIFGAGGSAISVRSADEATGPRIAVSRDLDVRRLRPGAYTLEVTVEQGGRKVRRRAPFRVEGPTVPPQP